MPDLPQESFWSIERVVVLLSPIFTGLAAWLVGFIANTFPGHPKLNAADVRDLMLAGALVAGGLVYKWLHGRQKPEVAQLGSLATLRRTSEAALTWLEANRDRLTGPPGAPGPAGMGGPTPEQVRAIVREEWKGLLTNTQAQQTNPAKLPESVQ